MHRPGILTHMAARRFRPRVRLLVGAVLAAGIAGYVYFLRPSFQPEPPAAPTHVPPPPPLTAPTPTARLAPDVSTTLPEPVPPLAESDDYVRDLAGAVSSHQGLAAWLLTQGLVRRFVAAVDNVVAGDTPRPHLGFMAPGRRFQVVTRGDRTYLDPAGYTRYDATADVIASLDPAACVELYRKSKPLIDDAYRELGYGDQQFDDALARAIAALLATPVVEGEVALTPKVVTFAFADPKLEELTPAQKHLLRMGPRNVRAIQGQLRALAEALALPAPTAAPRAPD